MAKKESSNRTFMELKQVSRPLTLFLFGSNRTFMELKHNASFTTLPSTMVLIVPLWN